MKYFLLFVLCSSLFASYGQGSGRALAFNGNDQVTVAHNNTFNFGNGDFTYEMWMRPIVAPLGTPLQIMELLVKRTSGQSNFELQMGNNGNVVAIIQGGGNFNNLFFYPSGVEGQGPPLVMQSDVWYHVCFSRRSNLATVYVNGEPYGSKLMPGMYLAQLLSI